MKPRLFIGILIIALPIAGLVVWRGHASQHSTITLELTQADASALHITFNDKSIQPAHQSASATVALISTYRLPVGAYAVQVSGTGYQTFQTSVKLQAGQPIVIRPSLQLDPEPQLTSAEQLGLDGSVQLSNVNYYYDNAWATFELSLPGLDPTFGAASYRPTDQKWSIVAGPGTYFDEISTAGLPAAVQNYLTSR